jgi:hypothetical protein
MNILEMSQYQPKLSIIANVAPADQPIRLQYSHQIKLLLHNFPKNCYEQQFHKYQQNVQCYALSSFYS